MNDNLLLASAGDDIKIWNTSNYDVVKQFNPHSGNIARVAWSHNKNFLASASTVGDKIGLAVTNAAFTCRDVEVALNQTCVAVSASSKFLLTGGKDGRLNLYDLKSKKLYKSYEGNASPITCVTFNANDTYVAGGTEAGEIHLYSTVTGQGASPLTVPKAQAVQDLQYSYFKKALLASVSDDGSLSLWDASARCLLHLFAGAHKSPATGLAFSPLNNMLLMSVGLDKKVVFYDVVGKSIPKVMSTDSPLTAIDIMSDGYTLAVGTIRGLVYVYDLRKASQPIKTFPAHKSSVRCLRFQKVYKTEAEARVGRGSGSSTSSSGAGKPGMAHSSASAGSSPRSAPGGLDSVPHDGSAEALISSLPNARQPAPQDFALHDVFSPATSEGPGQAPGVTDDGALLASRLSFATLGDAHNGGGVFSPGVPSGPAENGFHEPAGGSSQSSGGTPRHGSRVLPMLPGDRHQRSAAVQNGFSSDTSNASASLSLQQENGLPDIGADAVAPASAYIQVHAAPASLTPRKSPAGSEAALSATMSSPKSEGMLASMVSSPRMNGDLSPQQQRIEAGAVKQDSQTGLVTPRSRAEVEATTTRTAEGRPQLSPVLYGAGGRDEAAASSSSSVLHFQTEFLRSIVADALDDFRNEMQRDIRNLHAEMVRQFHIQETETRRLFAVHGVTGELMQEIQRLREENARLKKTY